MFNYLIVAVAVALSAVALPKEESPVAVEQSPVTRVEIKKEPIPEAPKEVVSQPVPPIAEAPKQVEPVKPVVKATGTTQGNCRQWLIDAGVTDLVNAVELQRRENAGCNPQKYNMGGSSACGVAQELPCGKSGCGLPPNADGACQIRWMKSYVENRYGSWAKAVQFHNKHNWY